MNKNIAGIRKDTYEKIVNMSLLNPQFIQMIKDELDNRPSMGFEEEKTFLSKITVIIEKELGFSIKELFESNSDVHFVTRYHLCDSLSKLNASPRQIETILFPENVFVGRVFYCVNNTAKIIAEFLSGSNVYHRHIVESMASDNLLSRYPLTPLKRKNWKTYLTVHLNIQMDTIKRIFSGDKKLLTDIFGAEVIDSETIDNDIEFVNSELPPLLEAFKDHANKTALIIAIHGLITKIEDKGILPSIRNFKRYRSGLGFRAKWGLYSYLVSIDNEILKGGTKLMVELMGMSPEEANRVSSEKVMDIMRAIALDFEPHTIKYKIQSYLGFDPENTESEVERLLYFQFVTLTLGVSEDFIKSIYGEENQAYTSLFR